MSMWKPPCGGMYWTAGNSPRRSSAPLVHGEPDVGPHPKAGLRSEPAASLGYLGAISTFHGKRPSAFEGDDLLRLANWVAERIFRDDWNRIPARSSLDRLAPQEAPS
jgi:hypothetical protein